MEDMLLIPVERETAKEIKKLKITKKETYDEIIIRLLKNENHNTRKH